MSNSQERRDYLVVRMLDGASLLNDLFTQVIDNKADPVQTAKSLSKKYEITRNQRRYLGTTVSRLLKAREVVGRLEERYGVDKKGVFRDKEALYRDIYYDDPPQKFSAQSQQVAVEFTLPRDHFRSLRIGGVTSQDGGYANKLDMPIDDQLEAVLEETTSYDNYYPSLSPFVVELNPNPSYSIYPNTLANRLKVKLASLLAGGVSIKEARRHEVRHVINHFLGYEGDLEELSAYSYATPFFGYPERVRAGVYFDLKNLDSLEGSNDVELLNSLQDLLMDLYTRGFDRKAISYIISTTEEYKLPRRLRLLKDYGHLNYLTKQPVEADQKMPSAVGVWLGMGVGLLMVHSITQSEPLTLASYYLPSFVLAELTRRIEDRFARSLIRGVSSGINMLPLAVSTGAKVAELVRNTHYNVYGMDSNVALPAIFVATVLSDIWLYSRGNYSKRVE